MKITPKAQSAWYRAKNTPIVIGKIALGATFLFGPQAYAQQINPQQQTVPQTNQTPELPAGIIIPPKTTVVENYLGLKLPPGYITLIVDLKGTELRMSLEQRRGKGDYWPVWMRPGLAEGNSFYWWLMARWHHNAGNQDLAYRSLLTAWVLTKIEASTCISRSSDMIENILRDHGDILAKSGTTKITRQEALLYSIAFPRKILNSGTPLRGMVCNYIPAKENIAAQNRAIEQWKEEAKMAIKMGGSTPYWRAQTSVKLYDNSTDAGQMSSKSALMNQQRELDKISKDFQEKRVIDNADINSILKTLNSTER